MQIRSMLGPLGTDAVKLINSADIPAVTHQAVPGHGTLYPSNLGVA